MKNIRSIAIVLPLTGLLIAVLSCGGIGDKTCGTGVKAQMLKRMLNAGDSKEYSNALEAHGSVSGDELPCVVDAINSWFPTKRKNGATTLGLVGGDRKVVLDAQKKVVLETSDLFVWAKVFDTLISPSAKANPEELATKRHDMIARAIKDDDGFIQSVGLKAGFLGTYPGIEVELGKRLDSDDAKVLAVALDALPQKTARYELIQLLKMLDEYERGSRYKDYSFQAEMYVPLLNALIRSESHRAYDAVRFSLEEDYTQPNLVNGTRKEFSQFRNTAAVLKPDESIKKFGYYVIAKESKMTPSMIDILATQVWTGKQEPDPKLVKVCVDTIGKGNLNPQISPEHLKDKPEQISCERLFYFLETGENPIAAGSGKKRKIGSDAVKFGDEWLKNQGNSD